MMKDIHKEGNTVVLITHDSNIARNAERVVRIADGVITSDTTDVKDVVTG